MVFMVKMALSRDCLSSAKIPYVGCGVLVSSISMDKLYTKIVVDTLGIRQAKYVSF